MKPRYLTHMFALTVMIITIATATAPLFGIELTNGDLNLFNGLNLLLLVGAGFLLYYIIRVEHAHDKAKKITDRYEALLANERDSKHWYKRRVQVLEDHQDKFPDPYREYICNIIANGSILPAGRPPEAKTATVYHEDYSAYGWYRLLADLGLIEYNDSAEDGHHPEDVLQGDDLQMFKLPDIEVTQAHKVQTIFKQA